MKINVIHRAKINIVFGFINKIIIIACPFIQRILVQKFFGPEYIGLNSLFASFISILNLSELGLNAAVLSHLYKPFSEDDIPKINAILGFYKKLYKLIGTAILVLGLLFIPFISYFVRESDNIQCNVYCIYLFFLLNTCLGYFLYAYVSNILILNQRDDVQSNISSLTIVLLNVFQAVVIIYLKNYYLFIILIPVFTLINNFLLKYFSSKLFPHLFPHGKIDSETKHSIKKLVIGSAINKICGASRHSFDSIFATLFLGLTITGYYNNYYMIIAGISSMLSIISTAFTGGIGNHVAYKSKEENLSELIKLDFLYLWIGGCITCILLCVIQPFMKIWMGEQSLLDFKMVILFCLYFYLLKFGDNRFVYLGAIGLWWENKYRALAEMISNIILNYFLTLVWGLYGIIISSIVSIFIFNHFGVCYILFKNYFGIHRLWNYHFRFLSYSLSTMFCCFLCFIVCKRLAISNVLICIVAKALLCFMIYNLIYLLIYSRTSEFKYLYQSLKKHFSF